MTIKELFDGDSIKLVVLGAAATLLAGAIVWLLRLFFTANPKVIWHHSGQIVPTSKSDGTTGTICIHRITLENVGRGDAKDIVISTNEAISRPKLSRKLAGFSLSNRHLIEDDTNFSFTSTGAECTILIPKLPAKNIMDIVYSGQDGHFVRVNSVTTDGTVAAQRHQQFHFLRERDVYKRAILSSLWFLLPLMVPFFIVFLGELIQGLWK